MGTEHSFGGHAMDRYLIDHETDAGAAAAVEAGSDGGEAGAAPSPEPVSSTAPGGEGEAAPSAAATAAAPTWTPDDPAFRDAVAQEAEALIQGRFGGLMQLEQQLAQLGGQPEPSQTPGLPEFDPLDPDSVTAWQDAREQRLLAQIDQRLQMLGQPLMEQQAQQAQQEGEQRLQDIIGDDVARNGEFASDPDADRQARDLVRVLAEQQFPTLAERYGQTPRAAEMAISQAAQQVRGLLRTVGQAEVTRHQHHTATLAGAVAEPGAGGAAVSTVPGRPLTAQQIAAKYGNQP